MNRILLAALATVPSLLAVDARAAPLANDSCASARVVAGVGTFGFDTTGASSSPEIGGGCDASIVVLEDAWDVWTAPESGIATISLCGTASFDATLVVYEGGACPPGPALACSLDACGLDPSVTLPVFAGKSYLVRIGSHYVGGSGPGSYSITLAPGLWDRKLGSLSITPASTPGTYDIHVPMEITLIGPATAGTDLSAAIELYVDGHLVPSLTENVFMIVGGGHCASGGSGCNGGCPSATACTWILTGTEYGQIEHGSCSCHGIGGGISAGAYALAPGALVDARLRPLPGALPEIATTNDSTPASLVAGVGTPFCFGDGSGSACPCGNSGLAGNGCASSVVPGGANVLAWGVASVGADTLALHGSAMPNSSALYFQGTAQQGGGSGAPFGDGLRCAAGTILRLATKSNVGGASRYPDPGDVAVSVRGLVTAGSSRSYQVWYRNAGAFCTPSTFNLTNGVAIVWGA